MATESGFQLALRQAESYELLSGAFMAPSAAMIVDSMGLRPGDAVLDLACGTGLVARSAWPQVMPDGQVMGVDVNPAMLTVARSLAPHARIEWVEASAQGLDVADEVFSHVACQQGLQFFPDARRAVSEVRRVLRPDGVFVATVWATPGHNPYIETQLELLAALNDDLAPSARAATPPRADEFMATLASDAGFTDVSHSLLRHTVDVTDLTSFFVDQSTTTPWGRSLAALATPERDRLVEEFAARLAPWSNSDGTHTLPFCSHQIIARK